MPDAIIARYPHLQKLRLEGEHRGSSELDEKFKVTYDNDLPSSIPCRNPGCDHAYHLNSLLSMLIAAFLKSYIGKWSCDGCSSLFSFSIYLTYHERRSEDAELDERISADVLQLRQAAHGDSPGG